MALMVTFELPPKHSIGVVEEVSETGSGSVMVMVTDVWQMVAIGSFALR